jgi:hypothetical protein
MLNVLCSASKASGRGLTMFVVACVLFCGTASMCAEMKLDFWHSYIHQPSGVIHYSFQIANYKRGIFFGSCGPSTRSLQWAFDIDLAGKGPTYNKDQIKVTSDTKRVEVVSGTVTIEAGERDATINLRVKSSGSEIQFTANGTHRIVKLK